MSAKHEDSVSRRPDANASPRFGRRQVLAGASTLGLAAIARSTPGALRSSAGSGELDPDELEALLAATCTATPTATEGPYYLNLDLLRKDVTDGELGVPLHVYFRIVRLSDCSPIPDVAVDLWHANAPGHYSGFPSQGTGGLRFLRGTQVTDVFGLARFYTVYPGWYPGRCAHVHVKVHTTPTTAFTSQTYFPDTLTDEVYQLPPYDTHGPTPTHNANDGIFDARNVMQFLRTPDPLDGLFAGIKIAIP